MPDIPRDLPALIALYPDNSSGLISAQDGRDALVSTHHGVAKGQITDGDYYVCGTHGDDLNPGTTIDEPFATIQKAVTTLANGQRAYVRSGLYQENVAMGSSGAAGSQKELIAYPGERVVIDASQSTGPGLDLVSYSYWTIDGFTVTGSINADGFRIAGGTGNMLKDCISIRNGGNGFYHTGTDNLLINCHAYFNDNATDTANGFAAASGVGTGNRLVSCVAYRNSNNGFTNGASNGNNYVSCISIESGRLEDGSLSTSGNGLGFEIRVTGSNDAGASHRYLNCVSLDNEAGFVGNAGATAGCSAILMGCSSADDGNGFADNQAIIDDQFLNCSSESSVLINGANVQQSCSWGWVKASSGNPTVTEDGYLYINTVDNIIRMYAEGAWRNLSAAW